MEAYITDLRDELEEAKQDEAAMLYKKEELLKEQRNIDVMQTAVDYVNEINDNRSDILCTLIIVDISHNNVVIMKTFNILLFHNLTLPLDERIWAVILFCLSKA